MSHKLLHVWTCDFPNTGRTNISHTKLKNSRSERKPTLCGANIPEFLKCEQHTACCWSSKPGSSSHLAERHCWSVGFEHPDYIQAACQRLNEVGSCFATHHFSLWHASTFPGTLCW